MTMMTQELPDSSSTYSWKDCGKETPKEDGIYEVLSSKGRVLLVTYTVTDYGGHWGRLHGDDLRDDRQWERYTHWREAVQNSTVFR